MNSPYSRHFVIPKGKDSGDLLKKVDLQNKYQLQHICNTDIPASSWISDDIKPLDNLPWNIIDFQYINNKALSDNYKTNKDRLKQELKGRKHIEERIGFYYVEPNKQAQILDDIIENGIKCIKSMKFNALGSSENGVYLCRYLDVLLENYRKFDTIKVILVKVNYVNAKLIKFDDNNTDFNELIHLEPEANYQAFFPQQIPKSYAFPNNQYKYSMQFFFDLDDVMPKERPENMIPIAIVTFKKDELKYKQYYTKDHTPFRVLGNYEKPKKFEKYLNKHKLAHIYAKQPNVPEEPMDQQSQVQSSPNKTPTSRQEPIKRPHFPSPVRPAVPLMPIAPPGVTAVPLMATAPLGVTAVPLMATAPLGVTAVPLMSIAQSKDPRIRKIRSVAQKAKEDSQMMMQDQSKVKPKPVIISYLDDDQDYDDNVLDDDIDDEAYLHIDERLHRFGVNVTVEQIQREIKRHYPDTTKGDDQYPKWRIMYDRTGRLDHKFRGTKHLRIEVGDIRHTKLKFKDEEKTTVDLTNNTNKLLIDYQTKKKTKNLTVSAGLRPIKKLKSDADIDKDQHESTSIKTEGDMQMPSPVNFMAKTSGSFLQQLRDNAFGPKDEPKPQQAILADLIDAARKEQAMLKANKQNFNSESTSLEKHLLKTTSIGSIKTEPNADTSPSTNARKPKPQPIVDNNRPTTGAHHKLKIKTEVYDPVNTTTTTVTITTTTNSHAKPKKSFWDSSSSDDDDDNDAMTQSGERIKINKKTSESKYCERVYIKLNNLNKSPEFAQQLLAYSKQYYEQNMHSLNAELLKLESRLNLIQNNNNNNNINNEQQQQSYKHYFRNNRNEDLKFDVNCLKDFKIVDEANIFSSGPVVGHVHAKRMPMANGGHVEPGQCHLNRSLSLNGVATGTHLMAKVASSSSLGCLNSTIMTPVVGVSDRKAIANSGSAPHILPLMMTDGHNGPTGDQFGIGDAPKQTKDQVICFAHDVSMVPTTSMDSDCQQSPIRSSITVQDNNIGMLPPQVCVDIDAKMVSDDGDDEGEVNYDFPFSHDEITTSLDQTADADATGQTVDLKQSKASKKPSKKRISRSTTNERERGERNVDVPSRKRTSNTKKSKKKEKKQRKKSKKKSKQLLLLPLSSSSSSYASLSPSSSIGSASSGMNLSPASSSTRSMSPSSVKKSRKSRKKTKKAATTLAQPATVTYDDIYSEYDLSDAVALESLAKVESQSLRRHSTETTTNKQVDYLSHRAYVTRPFDGPMSNPMATRTPNQVQQARAVINVHTTHASFIRNDKNLANVHLGANHSSLNSPMAFNRDLEKQKLDLQKSLDVIENGLYMNGQTSMFAQRSHFAHNQRFINSGSPFTRGPQLGHSDPRGLQQPQPSPYRPLRFNRLPFASNRFPSSNNIRNSFNSFHPQ